MTKPMSIDDLAPTILDVVLRHYPNAQAIYLFGSHADNTARPDSDVDIALLLPPAEAATVAEVMLSPCQAELMDAFSRDVDLINMRRVSTVFQKEILANHVIRVRRFGVPATSSEAFDLLYRENVIDAGLADRLKMMVQFRKILVHQDQRADLALIRDAIENGLDDLLRFSDVVMKLP